MPRGINCYLFINYMKMVIKIQSAKMNDSKQILTSDMCRICMITSDNLMDVINYELTPSICKMLRACTQLKVSFF